MFSFFKKKKIVAHLKLSGVIGNAGKFKQGIDFAGQEELIKKAFSLKKAACVAISINSPGGSPVQSHLIYSFIRQQAKKHKKKVIVFAEDVAASGGYLISCAGDEIYANSSSIIGSIGVIYSSFGFTELIKKIGVERRVHTAGKNKSTLDPFLEEKNEDIERLKNIQLDLHKDFIDVVEKSRGSKLNKTDVELFSGEFWSSIILQMPSSIQDGNSASYGESKMNTIVGAAAGVVKETMTGVGGAIANAPNIEKAIKDGLDAGKDAFSGLKNSSGVLEGAKTYLTNSLTASALGALGGNVSAADLLARETGQVFNPNMELLFNGPTLRSFRFSFKFTPRNAKEAEQVKLIIRTFKSNMAPKVDQSTQISGNSLFIKTPNVFELRYRRGIQNHPFLHKFKQCFLTDVSVNYTGEGVYATYDDSTPISMQMDLTFKELEPIYNTDYEDSDVGVGF
jgi:signal peptide peptidase SppA